jgi:hypothetical protein
MAQKHHPNAWQVAKDAPAVNNHVRDPHQLVMNSRAISITRSRAHRASISQRVEGGTRRAQQEFTKQLLFAKCSRKRNGSRCVSWE